MLLEIQWNVYFTTLLNYIVEVLSFSANNKINMQFLICF